ncbi:unnamed protein product [Mytilus edulis]|uniref:Reverse transcriptase domain-containing protein n=1 Tax=Mytilus edulis TaxID=6550 RepID=A0A8S3Q3J6_MYTED|nr:unnamed protein product [Mytilus edulis]
MKPPKRLRKPKGMAGKSPNKKKKTQGTLPELAGVTDKETVPFQVDIGSIAPVDQTPGQHMAYVMAGNDQHQVPRQPTTGMFNNTGLSDCNRGYAQGLNLEIVHESVTPMYTSSVFDSVGAHIPVKIKEKIWAGEYIDLNILLKSAKDLATDSQLNGDLSVKGGLLTITPQRQSTITNLHVWTSAFIIFMDIVLEKWPNKGQEFLKYMFNVRLASSRGYGSGWAIYDEQYRLRKARCPQSSWAELDMELWVMYVSTPPRFAHSDTNSFGGHKGSQYVQNTKPEQVQRPTASCKGYNFGRCALETTLLGPAKRGKDYELYSLGYSPICVNEVEESLKFYPYKVIANELIHGLRFGFKLQYSGSRLPVNANNSKSVTIHADLVREKINKEITLGRMAGPFDHPPLPTLRISPIFLAEKKNGDYRLIHNLSYPLHNSVNDFIDEKYCSVQYSGIDDAVRLVQNIGIAGKLSKSDVKSAFRLLRVSPSDFDQLGFIFDGKYYFDRCLPQGASISCSLFEKFSTALHWVTELTSGNSNILHYLDDFLFGGEANSPTCQETLETFKKICSDWGVPLAEDKTVQPTEILTFLGIEFDTLKMEMRLPGEKLTNLKQTLQLFLHSKKVTLRQLQSLIGLLNFACQVIAPGRAFCRRLIDATCNIRKPHHRGLSASTVLTYMSGISYQHKIQDLTDSTKFLFSRKTLEGLKRSNPKKNLRVPISIDLLRKLIRSLQHVCFSSYESVMFASAFSLSFFALLRVGEIAAESKTDLGAHVIQISDVSVVKFDHKEELRLCIRSSKTDQLHSSLTLIISEQIDKSLCPIHLLKQFLQIRYPSSGSNLYIHFDGSSLTRYQFSSILQKSLSFSEINGHFRAHSFRIGGATEAKRLGVDDETLKKWGRWTSDAYTKYIRVKTIWLIGSSIVYWANKEASSRPGGLHLGLQNTGAHMIWIGQRGMKWGDLNRVFEQRLLNRPLPSFLVIQLGSNDLGISTSEKLFSDIECDLLRLHALYPALKIIWSDILMRRYWHNANCGQAIERARKRVNLRVKNLVLSIGGCAIRHSNIRAKESNLFRYDGTHLSKIGNDIYLNNLQGALEQFMRSGGPAVFPQ